MIINRNRLIEDLYDFALEKSGLIVGLPGIGKSFCLKQLAKKLLKNKVPAVFIPVDLLFDGSDNAIANTIGAENDWISFLNKIEFSHKTKGVVIFDAFDAARDHELRKQILFQVNKAYQNLNNWNTIVSVRTYDATKSTQLQNIFGVNNLGQPIACNHFNITELNAIELNSAFANNPNLEKFYNNANEKLKAILKTPFFLKVLESVVEKNDPDNDFEMNLIKSESQLLDIFWTLKISNTENYYKKEELLTNLANKLVQKKRMSVLKKDFVSNNEIIFKELRSDNIIDEVGFNNGYVAFSHNILFDYIVGRLVIPHEPKELIEFINQDKSRPFLLRPSFIYHFTHLWHNERELFLENYYELGKQLDSNITLFRQLVPTTVIAFEYNTLKELKQVLEKTDDIKLLLQSMRFLSNRKLIKKDIDLLLQLSENLEINYIWDFSFVFEKVLKDETYKKSDEYFKKCGEISRNFLQFILDARKLKNEYKTNLDRIGSSKGIDFVSKTFNSNKEESINLFREILKLLEEPNFEIWYFSNLTSNLGVFITENPDFTSEIYQKIFMHSESAEEQTKIVTVTMSLVSNRKQDFEMCYYNLIEHYSEFLYSFPELAIKVGLEITNNYIINKHLHKSSLSDVSSYEISLNNNKYRYVPDFSSIWAESIYYSDIPNLNLKIIDFFKKIIVNNEFDKLDNYLSIYLKNAATAFSWQRLIKLGNEYPNILKDTLFGLLLNQDLVLNSEIRYELGVSINKVFEFLTKKKRKQIEAIIISVLNSKEDNHKANRLANCIPRELLQSKELISLVDNNAPIKNEPTFQTEFSSEPYTTEKWLSEQGVDLNNEKNRNFYTDLELIQTFNRKNLNSRTSEQDFDYLFPLSSELYRLIDKKEIIEEDLIFSGLKEICQFYSIALRNPIVSKKEYSFIKDVVLYCMAFRSKYDKNESIANPSGYTPTPRIEASVSLMDLYLMKNEDEVLTVIKKYTTDPNPVVRFNILRNIASLWQINKKEYHLIIMERLQNETDTFSLTSITQSLFNNEILNDEKLIKKIITLINSRIDHIGGKDSFIETYIKLLIHLHFSKQYSFASETLNEYFENTYFSKIIVNKIFDYIEPKIPNIDYSNDKVSEELFPLLKKLTEKNLNILKATDFKKEPEREKDRLLLIDHIILRIYFALDINKSKNRKIQLRPSLDNKKSFYNNIEPILLAIVDSSKEIDNGIIIPHTAHNLIKTLNGVLHFYSDIEVAKKILSMIADIISLALSTGYTFDNSAITEIVKLTETIFADYTGLLKNEESMTQLIAILNTFVESGWVQALELLWQLNDVFK